MIIVIILWRQSSCYCKVDLYLAVTIQMFDRWVIQGGWLWVGVANTVGFGLDIGIHTSFIKPAIA